MPGSAREIDEGEYATLRGTTDDDLMHFNLISKRISLANCDTADDTSEEGKLLDCLRDDSVTYASTRDLEPPMPPPPPPLDNDECELYADSSTETLVNPITVTVHTNEIHVRTFFDFFPSFSSRNLNCEFTLKGKLNSFCRV